TGTLTWTPGFTHSGTFAVTFTATNTLPGSAVTSLQIANVDRAPVVTVVPTASGPEGALLTVSVTASDPDGDAINSLSANLVSLPSGDDAQFNEAPDHASGTLTWTPAFADSGLYSIPFQASNALAAPGVATSIHVTNVDRAPVIGAPATIALNEGGTLSLPITVADPDGDAISAFTA